MCKDDIILDISCKGYLFGRVILFISKAVKIIGGAIGLIQICGANGLMVHGGMVFCKIIHAVETAFFPKDNILALANMITNPLKAHVGGFGSFLFDSVIGNAGGGAVVSLDWGGGLGVA
jgi:hypothetical protein